MRFVSLTSWTTTLWLKDDPMSTSFASTEWVTTGFIKQFSTGIANSIYNWRHTSKVVDVDKKANDSKAVKNKSAA